MEPKEGTFEVTPEMANFWLTNYNYEHQRQIRKWHVQNLASEITFGRFLPKTQINFCFDGDHFYLTNGQHTLSAIVLANEPVVLNVAINSIKTFSDVADIYARHDTHLTRQLSDSLVAHNIDKRFGISKSLLNIAVAGIGYYMKMTGDLKAKSFTYLTNDSKLEMVNKYGDDMVKMITTIGVTSTQNLHAFKRRRTTIGSLFFIYNHKPEKCIEFATTTFEDDGLKKGDPRKALIDFLKTTITSGAFKGSMRGGVTMAQDHTMVKNFALSWNAFYKRKNLTFLRPNHADREVYFEGCGIAKV